MTKSENTIPVRLECPVCSKERTIYFGQEDMKDEAFVEILPEQPWKYTCEECERVLKPWFQSGGMDWAEASLELNQSLDCVIAARFYMGI